MIQKYQQDNYKQNRNRRTKSVTRHTPTKTENRNQIVLKDGTLCNRLNREETNIVLIENFHRLRK